MLTVMNPSERNGITSLPYPWPHLPLPNWTDSEEQKEVTRFLMRHNRAFVLSDMRTGKSLSTLWAIDQVLPKGRKAVIFTRKSTMVDTWLKEAGHISGNRSGYIYVIGGKQTHQLERIAQGDILIANHDVLKRGGSIVRDKHGRLRLELKQGSVAEALFRSDPYILVLDEITAFRNLNTNRTWLLRNFMRGIPIVWALTGTPNPSSPLDAHGLARIMREDYKESKTAFRARTMVQRSRWTWEPIAGVAEVECAKILVPNIRYSYGDVFEPDRQDFVHMEVPLSEPQAALYNNLKKTGLLVTTGESFSPANEASLRSKFLQIASGGFYEENAINLVPCMPRLYLLRQLMQGKQKVIVYVPFNFNLRTILTAIPHGIAVYSELSAEKRAAAFDRFRNSPEPCYLVADPGVMAHGLNLSVADTIIYWGPIDRHETWQQANRRVVKPGGHSTVYMISSTPLEKRVYERAISKESFQGLVLEEITRGQHEQTP